MVEGGLWDLAAFVKLPDECEVDDTDAAIIQRWPLLVCEAESIIDGVASSGDLPVASIRIGEVSRLTSLLG